MMIFLGKRGQRRYLVADKKDKFSLEDSDKMISDVIDSFFQGENVTHDIEELGSVTGLGEAPPGYHFMPDGSLMLDSEMV